jgi:hypothetical protein
LLTSELARLVKIAFSLFRGTGFFSRSAELNQIDAQSYFLLGKFLLNQIGAEIDTNHAARPFIFHWHLFFIGT